MSYEQIFKKLASREELTESELKCVVTSEFHAAFSKHLKNSTCRRYIYMLTFTIDANKGKGEEFYSAAEKIVIDTAERTALQLLQYQYVKEYTKQGIPHWHALVVTKKPLKKDRFNYYIKKFGNIDISKNKAQQSSEIINYMSKISEPIILL